MYTAILMHGLTYQYKNGFFKVGVPQETRNDYRDHLVNITYKDSEGLYQPKFSITGTPDPDEEPEPDPDAEPESGSGTGSVPEGGASTGLEFHPIV